MERAAVLDLIALKRPYQDRTNPQIIRPPSFITTTFMADLMDVHPRTNGDVRVLLVIPYQDRHAAFELTDAWGANLRVTITRVEEEPDGESAEPEDPDRPPGGGDGIVDLSYQRNRAGRRPHLD